MEEVSLFKIMVKRINEVVKGEDMEMTVLKNEEMNLGEMKERKMK